MTDEAAALGANAVVGVDLDYEAIGEKSGMLMVSAGGPAALAEYCSAGRPAYDAPGSGEWHGAGKRMVPERPCAGGVAAEGPFALLCRAIIVSPKHDPPVPPAPPAIRR